MSCHENVENTHTTDEISARLVITGFACDPHRITKLLGIQPDAIWRIGDALSFTSERTGGGWQRKKPLQKSAAGEHGLPVMWHHSEPRS
jgi:hypothetical protein